VQLVTHHHVHPHLLVAGDLLDDPLEDLAMETLVAKDLAHLLGLDVGQLLDFLPLFGQHRQVIVPLRERRGVQHASHGNRLREGRG
jgi:hypothetical protein